MKNKLKNSNISTRIFGKELVVNKLKNIGFKVDFCNHLLILDNRLKVDFKTCNRNNDWAKKTNCIGGFDRIDPSRFDYLVCVSFDGDFKNMRYFIFSKKETINFPNIFWKSEEFSILKNLTLKSGDKKSDELIKLSENKWDKINF